MTAGTLPAAIDVRGLSAYYGQARALTGLAITVAPGEIVALVGHNGAGKSTLLRCIAGIHNAWAGEIEVNGHVCRDGHVSASSLARGGLSFVREGAPVFPSLSVQEHLKLGERLAGRRGRSSNTDEVLELFPALAGRRHDRAALLSGGQRQMLALAAAFVSQPTILLLDEPSGGLAASLVPSVFEAIAAWASDSQLAVVLAEQNRDYTDGLSSREYELRSGALVLPELISIAPRA